MAIQSSLSVSLDDASANVPHEITLTISGTKWRLLLATFDDGWPSSPSWTSFVNSIVSSLVDAGYTDATSYALTTTEVT